MIFINCSLIKKRLQIDVPQQDSILFYEIKLDISEVSKILILVLILKLKTRKTRKFFKASKLGEFLLFVEIGDFRGFRVFDFDSYAEIENSENSDIFSSLVVFLVGGSCKFPRFQSFRFWPLYWNWKLGKLRKFFKTSKFERIFFISGNFFKTSKFEWIFIYLWKLGISEVSEF